MRRVELLAPGGDIDAIKAAVLAGADAIYCGLDKFNARDRATNITIEDLGVILPFAHSCNCKIFITINILILEKEIPQIFKLLNSLQNIDIDGVIVQDLGLLYILKNYYPHLEIHGSTQMTTHNTGQIDLLKSYGVDRVNLCRELHIDEVRSLTDYAHNKSIEIEIFVHGSYCISFSGICYFSSVTQGRSGNRGRCSQPCRDRYISNSQSDYPLNLKDNCSYSNLTKIIKSGVDSLKIEGRIKGFEYVYTIVNSWKEHRDNYYNSGTIENDSKDLNSVFNRGFTNGFLVGEIGKGCFSDSPRFNRKGSDNSLDFVAIRDKIDKVDLKKIGLYIYIDGSVGVPLSVRVMSDKFDITLHSEILLKDSRKRSQTIDREAIYSRLKHLENSSYIINQVNIEQLDNNLSIPFSEITKIRDLLLKRLNGDRERLSDQKVPKRESFKLEKAKPQLSVFISNLKDLEELKFEDYNIYYEIPNNVEHNYQKLLHIFSAYPKMIPYFPSILIGKNFDYSIKLLDQLKPEQIISNNSGIGYRASEMGIRWIAGPQLNITNSYTTKTLRDDLGCSGGIISNELKKDQIKNIKLIENFDLHYSIYHPIILMETMICIGREAIGCDKEVMDSSCLVSCTKRSLLTDQKGSRSYIIKRKGFYHQLYNGEDSLNLDILKDIKDTISHYMIDLRSIETDSRSDISTKEFTSLFKQLIDGDHSIIEKIKEIVSSTTNRQYFKGV